MTRQEEINKMAKEIATYLTSDKDVQVAFADVLKRGAEWADAHPDIDVRTMAAWKSGYQAAIDAYSHWISVEEELPPIRQGVIAYNGVTIRKAWVLEDGSWIAETHKEWERNCFKQYPVTHWMPLPEPVVSKTENTILKGGEV